MRLKRNRLKPYTLKKTVTVTDDEGGRYERFETVGTEIRAEIWPASGKLQAEIYGTRLNYILNMLCDRNNSIKEGDGLCYRVSETEKPDYKVISIKEYSNHLLIELEAI